MAKGLADRLLSALKREMTAYESALSDNIPGDGGDGALPGTAGAKQRFELLSQMTKKLEKLLELKRLEKLANETGEGGGAETRKARGELMRALKALDARRREGGGALFASAAKAGA